tara:strand:- start:1066 stop:1275 length:210 start_codon:yes stop_codon:yes gene_type:complete
MQAYTLHEKGFQKGDLVTHNRIGTLGIIVEIFSLDDKKFAKVIYQSGITRNENINDLLPTKEALKDETR